MSSDMIKNTCRFFALLAFVLMAACGGVEDDTAVDEAELINLGRGPWGSCTIQECNGTKTPGEIACHFGVCVCVDGGRTIGCGDNNGGTPTCKVDCGPVIKNPFPTSSGTRGGIAN